MKTLDELRSEANELREALAAERRPGRQLKIAASTFRGWGRSMRLPEIGSTMEREDYDGEFHTVRVIDHNGAYWSDSTCGQEGRWITIEVPAEYVTRGEASRRMRLAEIEIDLIPDAERDAA